MYILFLFLLFLCGGTLRIARISIPGPDGPRACVPYTYIVDNSLYVVKVLHFTAINTYNRLECLCFASSYGWHDTPLSNYVTTYVYINLEYYGSYTN